MKATMIHPNNKTMFDKLCERVPHYYGEHRWHYHERAIHAMMELAPLNALELGPFLFPLAQESVILDKRPDTKFGDLYGALPNEFVSHNLNDRPWPFSDRQFDCIIALQVLEHVNDTVAALNEIKRIAATAVISMPFEWTTGPADHVRWTWKEFRTLWQDTGVNPIHVELCQPWHCTRLLAVFDFEAAQP
jgi:SAM-dependent methyltransferase